VVDDTDVEVEVTTMMLRSFDRMLKSESEFDSGVLVLKRPSAL
jgi:hypothetical protein